MREPNFSGKDVMKETCPTCNLDKFLGISKGRSKIAAITNTNCPTCEGKGYIFIDLKKGKIK